MPFSYEIDQYDSSRLRRHLSRGESDSSERLEVKGLGPNLGQLARSAQVFDPNAYDGDGDGLVQDSTPFERPAVLSNVASVARGLASTTGGYGSYTPRGSWTVGLTNEEVAERAVPSTPAAFVEMLVSQGSTGNLSDSVQEALDMALFDEEKVAQLREALRNALDERPALRASFDRFGCPPIAVHPNKDKNDESVGYQGVAFGKQAIFITEKTLDKGAMSQWFGRRKFSAKVFSFTTFAPRVKGVDRAFAGESAEDIITHEWGHYLNYLVHDIAPDAQLRDLAGALTQDSWYMSNYYTSRISSQVKEMFDYFDGAMKSGEKVDQPDGIPFVKTVYGTSSPVEFFAESVAAYFSPRANTRKLLNDEAIDIVEQMLGIKQVSRSGFASRTGSLKSSTGSTLRNKTPQEIADIVVPKTKAEAIALADAHNALLTDPGGVRYTASEPEVLQQITPKGIDAMDFSPEAVSRMKEMVVEALSNNPEFYEAVQRYGMPPILITKPGERLDGAYAIAGVEGFPAISIDSTMREEALLNGFANGMYKDEPFILGTREFMVGATSDSFLIHEWAHTFNRLALDVHTDDEMKALARFWWGDTWELDEHLPKITKLLRKFVKPETRVDARYIGAQKFGKASKNHKSVDFTGYPHVKTQYGQSMPAEAFAEAVTAVLSKNVDDKELVSPELRRDVLDMLGFSPSAKEIDRAGSSEGRSKGFASKTVTRDGNDVRVIDKSDPFTPMSGSNWLEDATDDEIADAVVPMNMQDAIAMTTMNATYGEDPALYPTEVAKIAQLTETLLFKTGVVDSQGNTVFEIDVPIDFSPAGRQKAKDMVKRMMSESPEFAWMVRRFGCPPIMIMDEAQLTAINNTLELARQGGADLQLPSYLSGDGVGGFSIATLGITIRPKDTDDLPSGFNTMLRARKITGRIITNPDGSVEEEKERWLNNFGLSIADVGIHEWAHWFYSTIKGNKQLVGSSAMGSRQARLKYMFPNAPTADIEKMTKEFLDAFDVEGFIPFNTMSSMHLDRIMTNAYRNISKNTRNRTPPEQAIAAQRFTALIQDYLDNVVNAKKWSPTAAKDFADQIAVEFPYLVDDLPPLLAGTYATATRQELWAEAVLLLSSPDSKLKAKYLTPEIEAFIAYAFGLKPDRDPSTPYQKPWAPRSGLASSSRVRRLHAAQDSIPDRVSDKDDGFASRTVGKSSAKMGRETSSTSRFTVGDYDFDITDDDLSTYDWDTAYDQWTTWSGNWRMRHLSSAMMGIEQQPTKGGEESLSTVHEIMRSGELSNAPDHVKDSVRESLINTYKTMEKISTGDTVSDRPLYRGLGSVPDDSEILMAEQGETITFPLSAFTPDRGLATTFADMNAESDKKVILQLKNGAHVASSDYTTQIRDLEQDWVEVPIESVTQGEFTVVSKREKDGYTIVELSHSNTFDPLAGRMVPTNIRAGFASRSTGVVGKDFDGILEGLEAEDEPYDGRIKRILKNDLLKNIKELTSGELEERPIHSRLEKFKKRLLDSIRIEIGDDDIPMIMADPNPLIFQFMPDRRDWSKVRLPTLEIIKEAAKHIRENQSEEVSNENYEDVEEVFYRRLLSLLESTSEGSAEEDIGESVGEGWLSLYLTGLSRPMVTSQTGTGFENDVHDAFGHVGIGRGFDRHGEWANALSVMTMLDLPMFDDFTPEQKDGLKRMILDKLAYPHFQKIPGDIGREKSDGWWTRMTYGYKGDIQTVIDMLDVSDRTQVLNEDGSPKEVGRSGFSSISGASRSDISAIAQQDFVHIRDANARSGFASSSMRPERRVSDSAIRTLTDNMDFLRDNPPMGKGGKDLDDRWAEQTINKLRSGELTQEDVFDLMNAVIEILSNGFNEDPSKKDNPDGALLAYQKLVKRLRRLAVGGMSKDDMDDLRREQGIIPTVADTPKKNPYPGGRFGFSSTTAREELSARTQKRIDDIDAQVEELESVNARLARAISELEATGNWEGEKHDIFITEGKEPKTYTKEQLESNGWSELVVEDAKIALSARTNKINSLKTDRDSLDSDRKRLTGDYPETTMLIEELLLDEDNAQNLRARAAEVEGIGQSERMARFTDPSDPDAVYVVHFGASKLEGGQLDPSRSRGQVGAGIAGNTRQINDETARYMVGLRNDARRDLSILEEMKRQVEADGVIDFDAIAASNPRDSLRAGRARLLLGLNRRDPERSTLTPPDWQVANLDGAIGDNNRVMSRLDKVADQLIADDYQYTSTYRASALQDLLGSYGGRYTEGDSTEWGDNAKRSTTTGIHIFKVKIGDNAVEQNSVGETHLVGKHTPVASLIVDSNANDDNPAREIWKGWLDLVIEQDIAKNNSAITLSEEGRMADMPEREVKGKSVQWVDLATKSFVSGAPSFDIKSLQYTMPEVRERIKNRIMAGDKGGKAGQWSARKAQLLAIEYRKAGGGYRGGLRKTQRSLNKWTRQKWTTSDGKPAIRKGGTRRYLPSSAWSRLTPAQRTATNRKKIIGSRQGNQFVANTRSAENASRRARD